MLGNLNLCFAGVQSHALLMELKGVAMSTGSACDSESVTPSHVLVSMGVTVTNKLVVIAIRFGLGHYNTAEEVGIVDEEVIKTVNQIRALASE